MLSSTPAVVQLSVIVSHRPFVVVVGRRHLSNHWSSGQEGSGFAAFAVDIAILHFAVNLSFAFCICSICHLHGSGPGVSWPGTRPPTMPSSSSRAQVGVRVVRRRGQSVLVIRYQLGSGSIAIAFAPFVVCICIAFAVHCICIAFHLLPFCIAFALHLASGCHQVSGVVRRPSIISPTVQTLSAAVAVQFALSFLHCICIALHISFCILHLHLFCILHLPYFILHCICIAPYIQVVRSVRSSGRRSYHQIRTSCRRAHCRRICRICRIAVAFICICIASGHRRLYHHHQPSFAVVIPSSVVICPT